MTEKLNLSNAEFDALKECGNVGIGNAATALSHLINKKVEINIPETRFVPFHKFADEIGGPEKIVMSIYLGITGDLQGETLFVFSEQGAKDLIDIMMANPSGTTKVISEEEYSAIKEMSNIVIGAYLNSMADMLDLKILPSVPHTATDMAQSVVDFMLAKQAAHSDSLLIVKEKIEVDGQNIDGTFIIIFDIPSLKKMLQKLHEKYGV